jgi:hypothetical protein
MANQAPQSDQLSARSPDKAWKEALTIFFEQFVKQFFPQVHAEIDWSRGYKFLDKELQQIGRGYATGSRVADKLAQVYLKTGGERWLLIHVEIEGKGGSKFDERMYVYNYRCSDRAKVVSLAVVIAARVTRRLGRYESEALGCRVVLEYPVAWIGDFVGRWNKLQASDNPFAVVVTAQLKSLEAKDDNARKFAAKRELLRGLYLRGFSRQDVANLFRVIDYLITLPQEAEEEIQKEIHEIAEGKKEMLVTSWEMIADRKGHQRGLQEGLQKGLESLVVQLLMQRFGELSARTRKQISALTAPQLEKLGLAQAKFKDPKDLRDWLAKRRKPSAPSGSKRALSANRKKQSS